MEETQIKLIITYKLDAHESYPFFSLNLSNFNPL